VEARAAGADAILLIVAALEPARLARLMRHAASCGLAVLVEVHDRAELDVAIDAGARVVGVNNRNLRTLDVTLDAAESIAAAAPRGTITVAESGLRTRADLERLAAAGYRAFLIGERLMTAADPGDALRLLLHPAGREPAVSGER
jgi:indole-3-glycerol phosphate synthase